jgi:hypothetical protein
MCAVSVGLAGPGAGRPPLRVFFYDHRDQVRCVREVTAHGQEIFISRTAAA